MTEKEIVLKTVRELPDDCSIDEIADRIEFLAAVRKGLDQLESHADPELPEFFGESRFNGQAKWD